jgi:diaminohydroxyphosphoribosylaminopyrimidine deaminase/5-amino-6-(5-phosphoribosylamino)uracil reductase
MSPGTDSYHALTRALKEAATLARGFMGATSPNPPVGAAALDGTGRILSVQAHRKAGQPHAEALVLEDLRVRGLLPSLHTMVVTLEPCNHQGKTPPCTGALLQVPSLKKVIFALRDPNPKVAGGGAEALKKAGLEVEELTVPAARELLEPFSHWSRTGKPWVVVKTALDASGSMIPPPGKKTFTQESSIRFAHVLRRESDAILTGSGTILADDPKFTVRLVPDHSGKRRWLAVLDRRKRVPERWLEQARERGLDPIRFETPEEALAELGSKGCLQVLVEAGPTLSRAFLETAGGGCLWNRHVIVQQGEPGVPDEIRDLRSGSH